MAQPCVVLIGRPIWKNRAAALLRRRGFALVCYESQRGYVSRLAADQPALIIVDGAQPDAEFWITTARSSPASRRIPVVAVAGASATRQAALDAGANFALSPASLAADLSPILADHARVQPEAERRALLAECDQSLPPQAIEAIRLFNAGEYYRQHDLLEALWMEESGPVRSLYQAILQVGIAYYQVARNNRKGALKMLLRARQWLAILPDVCRGVDVAQLRADVDRVQAALEATTDSKMAAFDHALLRPVTLAHTDP